MSSDDLDKQCEVSKDLLKGFKAAGDDKTLNDEFNKIK